VELEFFRASQDFGTVKATVHKSGKLGFSTGAAQKLELAQGVSFLVARDKSDPDSKALYLKMSSVDTEDAYKVAKAGKYFYLRIKNILDTMGFDYATASVIFNIQEVSVGGDVLYKLVRKPAKKEKGRAS